MEDRLVTLRRWIREYEHDIARDERMLRIGTETIVEPGGGVWWRDSGWIKSGLVIQKRTLYEYQCEYWRKRTWLLRWHQKRYRWSFLSWFM